MKQIYIVILTYNGFADTSACLKSLPVLVDKSYRLHTIVVDNGSRSEELDKLKKFLLESKSKLNGCKIHLIENGKNLGFAKGNNVGIRYALGHGTDYVLILNNDTSINDSFITKLLMNNPDIIAPVIEFYALDGTSIYDYGGKVNWWTGRTTHVELTNNPITQSTNKQLTEKIDYVSGCCMLVARRVFETIGLYDEDYFFYFEDVDFCTRARKAGFRVEVAPTAKIFHRLSASIGRWSMQAIRWNIISNFIFITKNLGWRRITGYAYLAILTAKIIRDRINDNYNRNWRGARRSV